MKKLYKVKNISLPKIFPFIAAFAAIGVVTLVLTSAAPSLNGKSIEAESHSSQSNTTTVTDATASNNSYVQFDTTAGGGGVPAACASGGTYLWSNLEICGWPGPTNTGVPAGTTLTAYTGPTTITTNGTVIDGKTINGNLTVNAQNVTIRNSLINYSGSGGGGSGAIKILSGATAVVDHVEVNGNSSVHSCVWHEGSSVTITYVKCHDIEDGIFSWAATGNANSGNNLTLENSYIYNLNATESNGHWDGYQTEGAANIVLRHNTFRTLTEGTSAIALWNDQKTTDNVLVENNLIKGGGFSVYAQDYSPSEASPAGGNVMTNVQFTNNNFSNFDSVCVGNWGVWFYRSSWTYQGGPTGNWGANGNTRSGNTVIETGFSLDSSTNGGNPAGCS